MQVLPIGQDVTLWCGLTGRVVAIQINEDGVDYRIAYVSGTDVRIEWFPAVLLARDKARMEIGFKTEKQ